MAAMCMVAVEATIVSTTIPKIVADLGGLHLYSWVFSAFLLAQTVLTVVFGNLADVYGRKPIMLCGIAVFVLGSLLSGFAWSMPAMIGFRLIQGVGAGAMQPVAMVIVSDLYPARERGKVQGYLASVWAISALLGPIVGGLIVRHLSWAWIFWINIPIGFIAATGFIKFLHEHAKHERRSIDFAGAGAFTIAVTSLLVGLTQMGTTEMPVIAVAAAVFCASSIAFVWQELHTSDPMVSFRLWSHRPIATNNAVALLAGMALMGLTTFVPIYVQVVLRRSPVVAGLSLTTMLLGWPAGATFAARRFHRFELHHLSLAGALLLPLGAVPFVLLTPQSSPLLASLGSLIMGLGMGIFSVSSLVSIQELADRSQRGTVTASNLFSRNLGSTLGATLLGAVFNHGFARATDGVSVSADQLRQLLEAPTNPLPASDALRTGLQHSLNLTFWAMLAMTLVAVAIAFAVPHARIERTNAVVPE
jgi:EmrB/QacA subfamily drug resistance transporter